MTALLTISLLSIFNFYNLKDTSKFMKYLYSLNIKIGIIIWEYG
jgi:hypothetical protein